MVIEGVFCKAAVSGVCAKAVVATGAINIAKAK
jgi:hypothetical protein